MYAIIAGANKAGTTSLYRYLGDHPSVCLSLKKETNFFARAQLSEGGDVRTRYDALFPSRLRQDMLKLEASPAYLPGGRGVALRIRQALPAVRLVVVLRDPVSRLLSYMRSNRQSQYRADVAHMAPLEYVALIERVASGWSPRGPGPHRNALLQYERGCYAGHLAGFLEVFTPSEIHVAFYDQLCGQPREFMHQLAAFLAIDPGFYRDYTFVLENRTREHRSRTLQKWVARINRSVELWLNRHPSIRASLRGAYERMNERPSVRGHASAIDSVVVDRLSALYAPHNVSLAELLCANYPHLAMPPWLEPRSPAT